MNLNIWGDFQICISVPLREVSPFYMTSLTVHISDVNSCEYVLAILKGKGLKDYDIIKSFADTESETDSDSDLDVVFL